MVRKQPWPVANTRRRNFPSKMMSNPRLTRDLDALSGTYTQLLCLPELEREDELSAFRFAVLSETQAAVIGFTRREYILLTRMPAVLAGGGGARSFYNDVRDLLQEAKGALRQVLAACVEHDQHCEGTLREELLGDAIFCAFELSLRHSPLYDEYARWSRGETKAKRRGKATPPTTRDDSKPCSASSTPSKATPATIERPLATRRIAQTPPQSPVYLPIVATCLPTDELMFELDY